MEDRQKKELSDYMGKKIDNYVYLTSEIFSG